MKKAQEILKESFTKYVELNEEEWSAALKVWKPFSIGKNIIITQEGEVEKYFYLITDGLIRGYFEKNDVEYNMGFSYRGDPSGVFDSFQTQTPAQWSMETLLPTSGYRVNYENLQSLFKDYKQFERWGRLFFTDVSIGLGLFIRSLVADSAEEKFTKLMHRSPHVLQLIPQKHLASYLGMSPETFSRMRRKWMENELDTDQDF